MGWLLAGLAGGLIVGCFVSFVVFFVLKYRYDNSACICTVYKYRLGFILKSNACAYVRACLIRARARVYMCVCVFMFAYLF